MRKDLLTPVTLLWVAGFFLCANTSSAQEVRMTVGELFNRVEQANIDVRIARRNVDISAEEKKSAMAGRLLEEMRARAEQGLALSNDVTRYELNLSNLSYDRLTVTDGIDHLNRNLLTYLDLDEGTSVIPVLHFEDAGDKDSSPDIWMEQTRLYSPELKQADLDYELAQTEEKLLRSDRLPRIGLTAGDNLEGPITNRSPVLDKNLNRWWVGVQLSFNLSLLYKERGKLNAAKIESARQLERRKSREDDLDRRIDRACKYYKEACEQVRTQEMNVKLATENYRIVERRYSNDLSLLTDMLDASAQKLDAEVRLVNARTNVIYYYYQLKYISGTL